MISYFTISVHPQLLLIIRQILKRLQSTANFKTQCSGNILNGEKKPATVALAKN